MNYKGLLLLLTLTIFSANAQSYQPSIEIIEQFDDVRLIAFIHDSDLENYPQWKPLAEAPPLTISKAIQAVHNFHKKNDAKLVVETIKEIELRVIPRRENYWHYLVKIEVNSISDDDAQFQVYVVLMNGKVIPALTETESYK